MSAGAQPCTREAIFHEVRQKTGRPGAQAYLDEMCGDRLCPARVDSNSASSPTTTPTSSVRSSEATVPPPRSSALVRTAGSSVIGPYKLLEQIGEGGMGVVYMAEQQTPVRRGSP